jgi:hypothetical protein
LGLIAAGSLFGLALTTTSCGESLPVVELSGEFKTTGTVAGTPNIELANLLTLAANDKSTTKVTDAKTMETYTKEASDYTVYVAATLSEGTYEYFVTTTNAEPKTYKLNGFYIYGSDDSPTGEAYRPIIVKLTVVA